MKSDVLLQTIVVIVITATTCLSQESENNTAEDEEYVQKVHFSPSEEHVLELLKRGAADFVHLSTLAKDQDVLLLASNNEETDVDMVVHLLTEDVSSSTYGSYLTTTGWIFKSMCRGGHGVLQGCLMYADAPKTRISRIYKFPSFNSNATCPNSTELSSLLLLRRLADRDRPFKILAIMNETSLFQRGSTDFLDLVRHTLKHFNSPNKLANSSVGLVVTQVSIRDTEDSPSVVDRIKRNLASIRDTLTEQLELSNNTTKTSDDGGPAGALQLLDSLLAGGEGGRGKIHFLPRTGHHSVMPSGEEGLLDLVRSGLEASPLKASDLNFSLSCSENQQALESIAAKVVTTMSQDAQTLYSRSLTMAYITINLEGLHIVKPWDEYRSQAFYSSLTASRGLKRLAQEGGDLFQHLVWECTYLDDLCLRPVVHPEHYLVFEILGSFSRARGRREEEVAGDERVAAAWKEYLSQPPAARNVTSWYEAITNFDLLYCPESLGSNGTCSPSATCQSSVSPLRGQSNQSLPMEDRCERARTICMALGELESSATRELENVSVLGKNKDLFELLRTADKSTRRLIDKYDDVILLRRIDVGEGMTGRIMGKFLTTDGSQLEAYHSKSSGRYLIRDLEDVHLENNESCQQSRLMVSPENGSAFYELPNFDNPNCTDSTQLEQILFFRRLVNRARSVKILLIADAESILGEDSTRKQQVHRGFLNVAQNLGNCSDFANSIGLVLTQVNDTGPDAAMIVSAVMQSFVELKYNWSRDEIQEEGIQIERRDHVGVVGLIDSLTKHEYDEDQPKIYVTRALIRPGRLNDLEEMMEMRAELAEHLSHSWNRDRTTPFNSSCFHIPLRPHILANLATLLTSIYNSSNVILNPVERHISSSIMKNGALERSDFDFILGVWSPSSEPLLLEWMVDCVVLKHDPRIIVTFAPELQSVLALNGSTPVKPLPSGQEISNYMKSARKYVEKGLAPYNYSQWAPLEKQLLEQEGVVHAIYEITGEFGGEVAQKYGRWGYGKCYILNKLQHFQNKFCPEVEATLTGPGLICEAVADHHNSTVPDEPLTEMCIAAKVACTGWEGSELQ